MKCVKRELIKAYAGFHTEGKTTDHAYPVATGNWGCGAFNGDRQLKGMDIDGSHTSINLCSLW
jgi:poly(ADP-ribose) glycohydrolase